MLQPCSHSQNSRGRGRPRQLCAACTRELRHAYASGDYTQDELADLLEVSTSTISRLVRGDVQPEAGGPLVGIDYPTPNSGPQPAPNAQQVRDLRAAYATGDFTLAEVGADFGIHATTAHLLVSGERQPEAGGPIVGLDYPRHPPARRVLTDYEVIEIRMRYAGGDVTQKDLADDYGVSFGLISKIVRGKRYPDLGGPCSSDVSGNDG